MIGVDFFRVDIISINVILLANGYLKCSNSNVRAFLGVNRRMRCQSCLISGIKSLLLVAQMPVLILLWKFKFHSQLKNASPVDIPEVYISRFRATPTVVFYPTIL